MRVHNPSEPIYAPNSKGGPLADPERAVEVHGEADDDMVRAAHTPHAEDDDHGQARGLVREVLDDAARHRLVSKVVGHLSNGVTESVLLRALDHRQDMDRPSATGSSKASAATEPTRTCRPRKPRPSGRSTSLTRLGERAMPGSDALLRKGMVRR